MTTNTILMNYVRSQLGNGGSVYQKWAGIPGQAWCDAYVAYCENKTGNGALYCDGAKEINCPHSMNWCIEHLAGIPIYLAMEGDVSFFDWQPNGLPDHVGFVDERINADYYYTIEGNTSGGIVARRKRSDKEEQLTFRLHYTPTAFSADKKLEVDGIAGYNTIAVMQRWLNVDKDAILGQKTLKALQKKLGVTADALWGPKTTKALQKLVGTTQDGLMGPATVKAFQKYLNDHAFGTTDKWDKAVSWSKSIASSGKYKYKKWSSNKNTHLCPICNPGSGDGWNCIGRAFSIWRHGAGIKCACSCGVIDNAHWDKILKAKTEAEATKIAQDRIGVPVKIIRNGGKAIPLSSLQKGDICCLYNGTTSLHIIFYDGDGRYSDAQRGTKPQVRAGIKMSATTQAKLKVAIRYAGK